MLHSYMGWILSHCEQHREAIEHGRVAVKLSPESEMSSIMLFRVLWNAGEHAEASVCSSTVTPRNTRA